MPTIANPLADIALHRDGFGCSPDAHLQRGWRRARFRRATGFRKGRCQQGDRGRARDGPCQGDVREAARHSREDGRGELDGDPHGLLAQHLRSGFRDAIGIQQARRGAHELLPASARRVCRAGGQVGPGRKRHRHRRISKSSLAASSAAYDTFSKAAKSAASMADVREHALHRRQVAEEIARRHPFQGSSSFIAESDKGSNPRLKPGVFFGGSATEERQR